MPKNFYAVLGVGPTATEEQIRRRFRDLARERHPDRFRGADKDRAEADFQDLTEALNVLTDPNRRRTHDYELSRPFAAGAADTPEKVDKVSRFRAYMSRGVKSYREGNYLAAAEGFDQASKVDPEQAQAWHHLALACSHDARFLPRAIEAVEHACRLEPMKATYLKLAGRLLASSGALERAEQFYQEALTWGGEDPQVRQALEALRGDRRSRFGLFGGRAN